MSVRRFAALKAVVLKLSFEGYQFALCTKVNGHDDIDKVVGFVNYKGSSIGVPRDNVRQGALVGPRLNVMKHSKEALGKVETVGNLDLMQHFEDMLLKVHCWWYHILERLILRASSHGGGVRRRLASHQCNLIHFLLLYERIAP